MIRVSKIKLQILGILFILLFLGAASFPATASRRVFIRGEEIPIDSNASYLDTQVIGNTRYFVYLYNPDFIADPKREGRDLNFTMIYGEFNTLTDESFTEKVTDMTVYAFHYPLVIDSKGQAHTVFVTKNETLYYAVRSTAGKWTYEQITDPNPTPGIMNVTYPKLGIHATDPALVLNENDEPRIIYIARFEDDPNTLNDSRLDMQNIKTVMYTAKNESGWFNYDLLENSERGLDENNNTLFSNELRVLPSNPNIKIIGTGASATIYATWNNKFQLAAETHLKFMRFTGEFPDGVSFKSKIIDYVDKHGAHTAFRRAEIFPFGNSVLLTYGATVQGGPRAALIPDVNTYLNRDNWKKVILDKEREYAVTTVNGVMDENGTVYITWSMYNKYAEKDFDYDVYVASYSIPNANDIEDWDYGRVTQTDNIAHRFPAINFFNGSTEVAYIEQASNSSETIIGFSHELIIEQPETNSIVGFSIGIVLLAGFIALSKYFITHKLEEPEVEEEILPHMINLKDSIEYD